MKEKLIITLDLNEQSVVLHALKQLERKAGGTLKTGCQDLIARILEAQLE